MEAPCCGGVPKGVRRCGGVPKGLRRCGGVPKELRRCGGGPMRSCCCGGGVRSRSRCAEAPCCGGVPKGLCRSAAESACKFFSKKKLQRGLWGMEIPQTSGYWQAFKKPSPKMPKTNIPELFKGGYGGWKFPTYGIVTGSTTLCRRRLPSERQYAHGRASCRTGSVEILRLSKPEHKTGVD